MREIDESLVRLVPSGAVDDADLEVAADLIERRLEAAGVRDVRVVVDDGLLAVAASAAMSYELLDAIVSSGSLEFRLVTAGPVPAEVVQATPTGPGATESTLPVGAPICASLVDGASGTWYFDRNQQNCYQLGESLLPDVQIVRSEARFDFNAWVVDVSFGDDRFVTLVAQPHVGQNVAIAVDGAVMSAPTINEGITGRDVQITGDFTEDEARGLAAALSIATPLTIDFTIEGLEPSPDELPGGIPRNDPPSTGPAPRPNQDHWHWAVGVNVCGTWLADPPEFFNRAANRSLVAGIHSHGDGLVHLHPYGTDEAGDHATLRTFLEFGGWMNEGGDQLDLWAATDHCPPSINPSVTVFVDGEPHPNGFDVAFPDGSVVVIGIGTVDDDLGAPPSAENLVNPVEA